MNKFLFILTFFIFFHALAQTQNQAQAQLATYQVKKGDVLSKIAVRHKKGPVYGPRGTLAEIKKLNPSIKNVDFLLPKQKIILPAEPIPEPVEIAEPVLEPSPPSIESPEILELPEPETKPDSQNKLKWISLGAVFGMAQKLQQLETVLDLKYTSFPILGINTALEYSIDNNLSLATRLFWLSGQNPSSQTVRFANAAYQELDLEVDLKKNLVWFQGVIGLMYDQMTLINPVSLSNAENLTFSSLVFLFGFERDFSINKDWQFGMKGDYLYHLPQPALTTSLVLASQLHLRGSLTLLRQLSVDSATGVTGTLEYGDFTLKDFENSGTKLKGKTNFIKPSSEFFYRWNF